MDLKAANLAMIAEDEEIIQRNERMIRNNERRMRWLPWSRRSLRGPTDHLITANADLREAMRHLRIVTAELP